MNYPFLEFFNQEVLLFSNELNYEIFDFFFNNKFLFFSLFNKINLSFFNIDPINSEILINYLNQTEDLNYYQNLENMVTIYHYSVPNVKLMYPEPFIASASFMHNDLWFIHILIYQYWLWFVFIFLIVFFFLTFVTVIRWCNLRTRPRRETRGVSRSKCGDLITACVPVSWATSIIVNESTDAIDFFDGFGTTEMVVGIRAYQWGWEYYYPKDIDLNYNIKKNFSLFAGNSIKYNNSPSVNFRTNNFFKFYQNKNNDASITPAHILLFSIDNQKLLNLINFQDAGLNSLFESSSFKKIKSFSKINKNPLYFSYNFFTSKYKNFSKLYLNDDLFYNSSFYGINRQHNFLTNASMLKNKTFFLNFKSINKLLNFNFKTTIQDDFNFIQNSKLNFKKEFNTYYIIFNNYFNSIINYNLLKHHSINFVNLNNYSNIFTLINNNSDKKPLFFLNYKIFNKKIFKKNLFNFNHSNSITNLTEQHLFFKNTYSNFFKNIKKFTLFSANQSKLSSEKYLRKNLFFLTSPHNYNINFNINTIAFKNKNFNMNQTNLITTYLNSKTNFFNNLNLLNNISKSFYTDYPSSPIFSNNPIFSKINYDDSKFSFIKNSPIILQTKEDSLPLSIPTIYWNFNWSNSNIEWRLFNNLKFFLFNNNKNVFPSFDLYYDYDFKNWQNMNLLENSYWNHSYSSSTFDEYLIQFNNYYNFSKQKEYYKYFNKDNKKFKFTNKIISKSFFNLYENDDKFFINTFINDNFLINFTLLNTNNFSPLSLFSSTIVNENMYEMYKNLNTIFSLSNFNLIFLNNISVKFQPTSLVLHSFKSTFDFNNWLTDDFIKIKPQTNLLIHFPNLFNQYNFKINKYFNSFFNFTKNYNFYEDNFLSLFNNSNRLNLMFDLRNTSKNSIIMYNALQKVFRSRFDENRSNAKIFDLSNTFENQPTLTSFRPNYELLIGKNKTNFFKTNFFKTNFFNFFNSSFNILSSNNFYIYDFPFLISLKSDASKYLWFDWYSRWNFYEVQPSSSSKYSIHGMPYYNKFFDFTTSQNETIHESETYLARIERARKNYLPNWTYTPYFFIKNLNWFKNDLLQKSLIDYSNTLITLKLNLNQTLHAWNNLNSEQFNTKFSPSNSNYNSFTRANWKPSQGTASYYYNISNLIDILTKREYLYRQLFLSTNLLVSLPTFLTANPQNTLLNELKSIFNFTDVNFYNNEFSKTAYFNTLNTFNNQLLNSFFDQTLLKYFFNTNTNLLKNNDLLYKNQMRPLKKGINNMLRLHATGAVAMPIEIRLQILASSKDVIHSWAIPSAGIKIDCVPGYSSHKVIVFLVSGIFWGQCMEICGRYHHWMPIVVYFMKRDLFFLWCTHFVFNSNTNNILQINDRQNVNLIKNVSFDKNSWISELI